MNETRHDFKNADDWEKKYRPIMQGNGIRERNNGTLFDRQGEDRKFINRMEREFTWSVVHNGSFEYIQAGRHNDSNVVGYLVTDNPVLFADLDTRFAIRHDEIDWKAFEGPCDPEVAVHDVIDTDDVSAMMPEMNDSPEQQQPAASVQEETADPPLPEIARGSLPPFATEKKKNKAPNPVVRLVSYFRRKPKEVRTNTARKISDEDYAAPMPVEIVPVPPATVPASIITPLRPEILSTEATAPAAIPAAASLPAPDLAPPEMPPLVMTPTVPISAVHSTTDTEPARSTAVSRPKLRFPRPKPALLPFPQLAPPTSPGPDPLPTPPPKPLIVTATTVVIQAKLPPPPAMAPGPTPAADPLPSPDTSAAAAKAVQVRVRYLPFGTDAAKLDLKVYGPWPNAAECKDCGGTGYFAGVVVGLIACESCEGRGWNSPLGEPAEIVVSVR